MWLTWRCWTATEPLDRIPLVVVTGLAQQPATPTYTRERCFRQRIAHWVGIVHALLSGCPVTLSPDKGYPLIPPSRSFQARAYPQAAVENWDFHVVQGAPPM